MSSADPWDVALARSREKGAVVELELLLPDRELAVLEAAARDAGLTIGELMRRLIRGFLKRTEAGGKTY